MRTTAVIPVLLSVAAGSLRAQTTAPSTLPASTRPAWLAPRTAHKTNYDESLVGSYTLPDPLVMADGQKVTTPQMWEKRRQELLQIYRTEIFGHVPENAPRVKWEVTSPPEPALDGAAVKKRVVGRFIPYGASEPVADRAMNVTLYTPANTTGPVPVIVSLNFDPAALGRRAARTTAPASGPATAPARAPDAGPAAIVARGWACASIIYTEIQPDTLRAIKDGVIGMTLAPGADYPAPDEWGSISAWAWGASRIADYLQTDASIDGKKIGVFGFSRLGKTALWTGAQDTRFSVIISGCAGEMGSAISRRDFGETIDDMSLLFPHQFAANFQKYSGHWNQLPVDAHILISLAAPRAVFATGGTEDRWADPKGEFLAQVAAGPVYRLLGKNDLGVTEWPAADVVISSGELGYTMHTGGHVMPQADWTAALDFAAKYWK